MVEELIFLILFFCILIRISYTDLRERRIGNQEMIILFVIGLAYKALTGNTEMLQSLISGLALAGMVELVNMICFKLQGIGGGDVKLIFVMGTILGFDHGMWALLIALILSLGFVLAMAVRQLMQKRNERGNERELERENERESVKEAGNNRNRSLPLGPFLAIGMCCCLVIK